MTDNANRGTFADWQARVDVFKRIAIILENHSFDGDKGLCTDIGKYENDGVATLYFHQAELDGDLGEYTDSRHTIYKGSQVELDIFGAMAGKTHFELSTDNNGFMFGQWIDEARCDKIQADALADIENEE